jgi:importin subunit alpha-1
VLECVDNKALIVAIEGIANILKCGKQHFLNENGENLFCLELELVGGLDKLENLQMHKNHEIYDKAIKLLEEYFNTEGEDEDLFGIIKESS